MSTSICATRTLQVFSLARLGNEGPEEVIHLVQYCRVRVAELWHMPVTEFDPDCVDAVRSATAELGYSSMEMVSGAGHDALYVAKVAPTSMIFVPCKDGLSHNEAEDAKPDDLEAGCNVLLHAMLKMANP